MNHIDTLFLVNMDSLPYVEIDQNKTVSPLWNKNFSCVY
jgi:hypothetical protein